MTPSEPSRGGQRPPFSLPQNWRQLLAGGGCDVCLALLPLIERFAKDEPDAYVALLPWAAADDFALRLRALLALGRLGQGRAFLPLVELLKQEPQNHWRLALLDTLFMLPQEDKVSPLLPLLAADQPGDADGCFLAGLIWFFGNQGPGAFAPLCNFLAQPSRARRIKDDLLAEAFFLAAGGQKELLETWARLNPHFYRFSSNRVWPRDNQPRFNLYPHPDYLLQKALQSGLTQGQFQRLHFWHRDKAGRRN